MGDSEDGAFWTAFLRSLKARGLAGVQLVISDAHTGLKAAIGAVMAGAAGQRCRVHFLRNVLARVPKGSAEMVAAAIRTIFAQPTGAEVTEQLDKVAAMLASKFPQVAAMLADAREDLTAFTGFPVAPWRKLWSTNPLERLNKEVKRRTNVVGIFPNDAAVLRLAGAILIEAQPFLVALGQGGELDRQHGRLQGVEPVGEADDPVVVLLDAAVVAQQPHRLEQLGVVGGDRAGVAERAQVLARVEGEAAGERRTCRRAPRCRRRGCSRRRATGPRPR